MSIQLPPEHWHTFLTCTQNKDGSLGNPKATLENLRLILQNDASLERRFRANEFTQDIEIWAPKLWHPALKSNPYSARSLSDADAYEVRLYLSSFYGLAYKSEDIRAAIVAEARNNTYDPLVDYLTALKWDGVPRLDTWLQTYLGVKDSSYVRQVARKWLVSAVARGLRPGAKVDTMLVLEGSQGLGKSTALQILGGPFFSDTEIDIGSREGCQQIQGVWIFEFAELDALARKDVTKVKAFLSQTDDKFRINYDKFDRRVPRRCVFAGTTNRTDYLQDETGARRFWPVYCRKFLDRKAFAAVRDQLWAEAVVAYQAGEDWWTPPDAAEFKAETANRTDTDTWTDPVEAWLNELGTGVATRDELMFHALQFEMKHWTPQVSTRLKKVMAGLGWTSKVFNRGTGVTGRFYVAKDNDNPDTSELDAANARRKIVFELNKANEFDRADMLKKYGLTSRGLPVNRAKA